MSFLNTFLLKIFNYIRVLSFIDRWNNGIRDYAIKSCGIQSGALNVFTMFPEQGNKFKLGQE
jgi:hypothetical protein